MPLIFQPMTSNKRNRKYRKILKSSRRNQNGHHSYQKPKWLSLRDWRRRRRSLIERGVNAGPAYIPTKGWMAHTRHWAWLRHHWAPGCPWGSAGCRTRVVWHPSGAVYWGSQAAVRWEWPQRVPMEATQCRPVEWTQQAWASGSAARPQAWGLS